MNIDRPNLEELVGGTPEIDIKINHIPTRALIDSGSQISAISRKFYIDYLSNLKIHQCSELLKVESVGGETLPYLGYLELEISMPLTDTQHFSRCFPILVVPDTKYNANTPFLMGTNILSRLPCNNIPIPSLIPCIRQVVRTMSANAEMDENTPVRSLRSVVVPAYSCMTVAAKVANPTINRTVLLEANHGIPVVDGVVNVHTGENILAFEVANYTDKTINIAKGQVIANVNSAAIIKSSSKNGGDIEEFVQSFDFAHLSDAESSKLKEFLVKHRKVFAMTSAEMGRTDMIKHHIELTDDIPIKEKVRPIPISMYDELKQHLEELLDAGIITESKSPYCSNIVVARKKDGTIRMCIDYRKVNAKTKKDAYQLPRPDTLIDCLKGAKCYASLDLFSGYNQIEMSKEDQEKTAFSVGTLGFFQFQRMPFGLSNSGSTFQRLMEKVLEGLTMKTCLCYIDDIVVFAETPEQLYARLEEVFHRLNDANLTLKPQKCSFFQESVDFLGFSVSKDGVRCSDKHIESVTNWPVPRDAPEVQTFLGFSGFYRKFVPGYTNVAFPLLKLIKPAKSIGRSRKGRRGKTDFEIPFEWGSEQDKAFEELKRLLVNAPILV